MLRRAKIVSLIIAVMLIVVTSGLLYAEESTNRIIKTEFSSQGRLEIHTITPNTIQVPKFGLFELDIDVSATYENPFDPEDIDLVASFTSPTGKNYEVPGFFHQEYKRTILTKELRSKVRQISITSEAWCWEEEKEEVQFYIDGLRLVDSKQNKVLDLIDVDKIDVWEPEFGANVEVDFSPTEKKKVMKLTVPVADKVPTPFIPGTPKRDKIGGISVFFDKEIDLGKYDKLEIRVYPKARGRSGVINTGFMDSKSGWQQRLWYSYQDSAELKLNQWNTLEWDFERWLAQQILEKKGKPIWKVRFTPSEAGKYTYYLRVKDRNGVIRSEEKSFVVVPSEEKGFVQISSKNPYYFQFENGDSFFPISENLDETPSNPCGGRTYFHEWFIPKIAENGVNFIRIRMTPGMFAIEFNRLGVYNLENASELDWLFDYAKKHGVYILPTIDNFGTFITVLWKDNGYNIKNGGMLNRPDDFLTDRLAKDFYKKKLRYIVARWGHNTNLFAWEFWNELSMGLENIPQWHEEMGNYLEKIDPYKHLKTTSFYGCEWDKDWATKTWSLPAINIFQMHTYDLKDTAGGMSYLIPRMRETYKKPVIIGEFANDGGSVKGLFLDPQFIHLHNGIWAGTMSGIASSPFHFPYLFVLRFNQFYHFAALSKFLKGEDFVNKYPLKIGEIGYLKKLKKPEFSDLIIYPMHHYIISPHYYFDLTDEKQEIDERLIAGDLGGLFSRSMTFKVNYPKENKFEVYITQVRGKSILKIYLDEEIALTKEFADPVLLSAFEYDGLYSIDVPAGLHTIKILFEGDSLLIGPYIFRNYKMAESSNIRILGLQEEDEALFWIQNKDNTWWFNSILGKESSPIMGAYFDLKGLKDGKYSIEWWDTYQGKVTNIEREESKGGILKLILPPVETDLACKVKRIK